MNHFKESSKQFTDQSKEEQATATYFEMKYGDHEEETVIWWILTEAEQITKCPIWRTSRLLLPWNQMHPERRVIKVKVS